MKTKPAVLILVAAAALLPTATLQAQATDPSYLSQFPPVERVQDKITGKDAMDTAARQMGAFWQLLQVIQELAGQRFYRNQLTPDENRLRGQYRLGYSTAAQPYAQIQNSPAHPDKPKWNQMHTFYETDPGFLDELLQKFFLPEFRTGYYKATGKQPLSKPTPTQPTSTSKSKSVAASRPGRVTKAPRTAKPRGRANSTLVVIGGGYTYTYKGINSKTGEVIHSFTERGKLSHAMLYLLEEDVDKILQRAGIEPGLMGSRLGMLAFLDAATQMAKHPFMSKIAVIFGQPKAPEEMAKEARPDFERAMKAIRAHSAAQMTTDANARGAFPRVPAGTYYLFGRFYRIRKPVRGGGCTWNLKVTLKPGQNVLKLSVENAALK